jgi:hypothetical protein
MASSVRALSNHYETLQVSPGASNDEIVRAFASHMRAARVRPDISVARLAQLSVAYETLHDPAKRRAYDASIGLRREPAAQPKVSMFIGAPVISQLNRLAEPLPRPAAKQPLSPPADVPAEPRVAAFIAASLREPAARIERASAAPTAPPEEPQPLKRPAEPTRARGEEGLEIEDGRMSIGRTGATLAAGVIGVAILAFATALPNRNPDQLPSQAAQAEPGVTMALPPPSAARDDSVAAQPSASATATATSAGPRLGVRRSAPAMKSRPAPWLALGPQAALASASEGPDAKSPSPDSAAQQSPEAGPPAEIPAVAADSAAASPSPAKLPLSNAMIARTIEHIGYGCGQVVSATGVEGEGGVFSITCSSGDTYRAAPVRGRYHFRRTGSH